MCVILGRGLICCGSSCLVLMSWLRLSGCVWCVVLNVCGVLMMMVNCCCVCVNVVRLLCVICVLVIVYGLIR